MEVPPFAVILHQTNWDSMCFYCFKESEYLLRCSKCKLVKYCSRDCQAHDWNEHGIECKSIQNLKPYTPASLVLFIARILRLEYGNIKRRNDDETSFNKKEYAMKMINHLSETKEKEKEEISELAMLTLKFIYQEEEWIKNIENKELMTIKTIISQIKCNDFTLCSNNNNKPIAHGCYPIPSLINHSCDPNIFHYFKGRNQILRCCKEIKVGEELFVFIILFIYCKQISYIDLNTSTKTRQKYLLDNYYFKCECQRCINNNNDDGIMDNYKCQYCNNDNSYCLPNLENGYECINCHKSSTKIINENISIFDTEYKKYQKSDDLNDKISHLKCVYDSAKVYINILYIIKQILYHCYNPKLTKICEEYVKLLIQIPNYELALEPCKIWTEGSDYQYPVGSISPYIAV